MAVTLSDIARCTGSSISAVSAALKGNRSTAKVSEKRKKKILLAAQRLGYRPSHAARALRSGKTNVLGFLTGEINTPHYGEIATLLMEEAGTYGYSLQTYVTQWEIERGERAVDLLLDGRCDGLIVMEVDIFLRNPAYHNHLLKSKVPTVLVNQVLKGLPVVTVDWDSGFVEAVKLFKQQGMKDIVFIGDNIENLARQKLNSLLKISKKNRLRLKLVECWNNMDDAYHHALSLKDCAEIPQAIISENDAIAAAVIKGLSDAGLKIPDDITLIGYNETRFSPFTVPALTTIGCDKKEFARQIMAVLNDEIEDKKTTQKIFKIPTFLRKRESTHV